MSGDYGALEQSNPRAGRESARFVVLRHVVHDDAHFDLMIQMGEALATWKFRERPECMRPAPIACDRIANHRLVYLDYEGPISGGRGQVSRHDGGDCRFEWADEETLSVSFNGQLLQGQFQLEAAGWANQGWFLRRLEG